MSGKTLLDIVNGHTEQIADNKTRLWDLEERCKHINCDYNNQHIEELHQENESLSMVYGDAYLVKLREMEDDIEHLFELFETTKKHTWSTKYMKFINQIMDFLGQHPETIAMIGTTMEDYETAKEELAAGSKDFFPKDGKVSGFEKALYPILQNIMKNEKIWRVVEMIAMGLGGFGLGLYLGGF